MSFTLGDIVLVPFPFADQSVTKLRPALVVSLLPKDALLVVYITSSIQGETDFDVLLKPTKINGLKVASIARMNRAVTIAHTMVTRRLGVLSSADCGRVSEKLRLLHKQFAKSCA